MDGVDVLLPEAPSGESPPRYDGPTLNKAWVYEKYSVVSDLQQDVIKTRTFYRNMIPTLLRERELMERLGRTVAPTDDGVYTVPVDAGGRTFQFTSAQLARGAVIIAAMERQALLLQRLSKALGEAQKQLALLGEACLPSSNTPVQEV